MCLMKLAYIALIFGHLRLACDARPGFNPTMRYYSNVKPLFRTDFEWNALVIAQHLLDTLYHTPDQIVYENALHTLKFLREEIEKRKKSPSSNKPVYWLLRQG